MNKKKFPTLYAKAGNNKTKEWSILVNNTGKYPCIIITHGYSDGDKTIDNIEVREGKNIGKANETTPWQQAVNEAQSRWQKKIDKGYREQGIEADDIRPMLAHRYDDRGHSIVWPAYVQPKLNGVRCMVSGDDDGVHLISRGGKEYKFQNHLRPELKSALKKIDSDIILDGELYLHGTPLQEIGEATRKQSGEVDRGAVLGLEYHVYDCFDSFRPELTFEERYETIRSIQGYQFIKLVPTYLSQDEDSAMVLFRSFVKGGYEGAIVRNVSGVYKPGHRSADLQKIKMFQDAEFEIVEGIAATTGSEQGCILWICQTVDGKRFTVRPLGSFEERKQLYQDREQYYHKMLTVRYFEISNENIPLICTGVNIRPEGE
jgi:DNA ligase-1